MITKKNLGSLVNTVAASLVLSSVGSGIGITGGILSFYGSGSAAEPIISLAWTGVVLALSAVFFAWTMARSSISKMNNDTP